MEIQVKGLASAYQQEHLARIFYHGAPLRQSSSTKGALVYARITARRMAVGLRLPTGQCSVCVAPRTRLAYTEKQAGKELSSLLYTLLKKATGLRPPWGMLTGVRPVHLLSSLQQQQGVQAARTVFLQEFDVSPEKYALAQQVIEQQQPVLRMAGPHSYSLYISIPFCPSRCAYCSFVSRTMERDGGLAERYLHDLEQELQQTAQTAQDCGLSLSAIYIGGGTPTSLNLAQLDFLLAAVARHFDTGAVAEYTVEAGRPDCTDFAKLELIHSYGVGRISINPQTMRDDVLQAIGRRHTSADFIRCCEDARRAGHKNINMDVIAGLPGDDRAGFTYTMQQVLALQPENVTVHTLTMKRASNLALDGVHKPSSPAGMLEDGYTLLERAGLVPYYLYRQKSTPENLENTGWARQGKVGLYNVFIMEECQTILACGAGGSTKLVGQAGSIQRVYNPKYPLEYCNTIEQVLDKKRGVTGFYARNMDTETIG